MATYYINVDGGSNTNNGTSPTTPWRNLNTGPMALGKDTQGRWFQPGDVFLLARQIDAGGAWFEMFDPGAWPTDVPTGTEAAPYTFRDYTPEAGGAFLPRISGARPYSAAYTWVASGSNWYVTVTQTQYQNPTDLWDNDRKMTKVGALVDLDENGEWFWDAATTRLYCRTIEGDTPQGHRIEGSVRDYALKNARATLHWLRFENIVFDKAKTANVYFTAPRQIFVGSTSRYGSADGFLARPGTTGECSFTGCRAHGNLNYGWRADQEANSNEWIDCQASDNAKHGFFLEDQWLFRVDDCASTANGSTGVDGSGFVIRGGGGDGAAMNRVTAQSNHGDGILIDDDTLAAAAQSINIYVVTSSSNVNGASTGTGIRVKGSATSIGLRYVTVSSNTGTGLIISDGARDCSVYYALAASNDKGFQLAPGGGADPSTGNLFYHLVAYGNTTYGFSNEGMAAASPAMTLVNSCFSGNPTGLYLDGNAVATTHTIDYNLYWNASTAAVNWNATTYSVAQVDDGTLYAARSIELHGIGKDPQWVAAGTNFRIPIGSPCRNAGITHGVVKDYYGNAVPFGVAPDLGLHEYQGELAGPDVPAAIDRLGLAKTGALDAMAILTPPSEFGFLEARDAMNSVYNLIVACLDNYLQPSSEPPPPPPPPPPPEEPPEPPARVAPPYVARFSDLVGVVPGSGYWQGWGVTPFGIASVVSEGGLIGDGAQAVYPLVSTFAWRFYADFKFDRTTLDRPEAGSILIGVASYGGQFVPRAAIVPNVPLPPGALPAPLYDDLGRDSLVVKLTQPQTDGVTLVVEEKIDYQRRSASEAIREQDVFVPGEWTRIEFRGYLSTADILTGFVRFAANAEDPGATWGPLHTFELPLIPGDARPFVWGWIGPLTIPVGWVVARNFRVDEHSET